MVTRIRSGDDGHTITRGGGGGLCARLGFALWRLLVTNDDEGQWNERRGRQRVGVSLSNFES